MLTKQALKILKVNGLNENKKIDLNEYKKVMEENGYYNLLMDDKGKIYIECNEEILFEYSDIDVFINKYLERYFAETT